MIGIGYNDASKLYWIKKACTEHKEIQNVVIFSPPQFSLGAQAVEEDTGCKCTEYTYADIIMYRVFYPLLEVIDDSYLIVVNECMRTQNRNDLTYNCLNHYLNQTCHRMIFEYFPMVDRIEDVLILLDREHPNRYKGRGYDHDMLSEADLKVAPHRYMLRQIAVALPDRAAEKYEAEKDKLFDALGNGDPDNVPRRLHVWCGRYKRVYVDEHPDVQFVARNARFARPNVATYANATDGRARVLLDIPHRQMILNDYLKRTDISELAFVTTGLSVDRYYYDRTREWINTLEGWYAQAGVCT